ncbi:hypothetical protein B0T16DRAFT_403472 [Cercophora newfieldiana]|uniref:Uncharacterized protein n=1 Tax=Cercophora newfieldiana TaxID=92897 RepID=A0AA40CW10_9PEZI|nr:hypothetical protein B0T16DRAFT_403472 [Cercophora newfieldiana]
MRFRGWHAGRVVVCVPPLVPTTARLVVPSAGSTLKNEDDHEPRQIIAPAISKRHDLFLWMAATIDSLDFPLVWDESKLCNYGSARRNGAHGIHATSSRIRLTAVGYHVQPMQNFAFVCDNLFRDGRLVRTSARY